MHYTFRNDEQIYTSFSFPTNSSPTFLIFWVFSRFSFFYTHLHPSKNIRVIREIGYAELKVRVRLFIRFIRYIRVRIYIQYHHTNPHFLRNGYRIQPTAKSRPLQLPCLGEGLRMLEGKVDWLPPSLFCARGERFYSERVLNMWGVDAHLEIFS